LKATKKTFQRQKQVWSKLKNEEQAGEKRPPAAGSALYSKESESMMVAFSTAACCSTRFRRRGRLPPEATTTGRSNSSGSMPRSLSTTKQVSAATMAAASEAVGESHSPSFTSALQKKNNVRNGFKLRFWG